MRVDTYTPVGYIVGMNDKVLNRLEKIRGQVDGIIRMYKSGRDCGEVVGQIAAVRSALGSVGKLLLRDEAVKCSQSEKHDKLERILKQLFNIS